MRRHWKKLVFVLIIAVILYLKIADNMTPSLSVSVSCEGPNPYTQGQCFTQSRDHSYKYIHNEPELCNGVVYLLVMVLSVPEDFTLRQTIRRTWGSFASRKSNIRLAFMLGKSRSETLDKQIELESETYHDVIQKDFIDSYRNLSLKSESILHYSNFYCQNTAFVLKTDSDMFINIPLLLRTLEFSREEISILGYMIIHKTPVWNKASKWHIDPSDYPLTYYPNYANGPCYVIPGVFIKSLFQMSLTTKLLPIEDAYITGILRSRLSMPIRNDYRFRVGRCDMKTCNMHKSISCHGHTGDQIIRLWTMFKKCVKHD